MPVDMSTPPFEHGYVPTLPNLIHAAVEQHGGREFLVMGDRRLTFADVERQSAELAKGLLALGVGKGTRLGLLMPNNPDWVLNYFAAARVGALTVALSTFFQASEISWGLRFNDIDTLLITREYLNADYIERLERALPGLAQQTSTELHLPTHPYLRRIIVWGDCDRPWAMPGPDAILAAAKDKPQIDDAFLAAVEANIAPADLLLTICTSGSTSEPKAVVHTHGCAVRTADLFTDYQGFRPTDRIWTGFAFFWIGGHNSAILPCLYVGSSLHFTRTPKPSEIVDTILREQLTVVTLWQSQSEGVAAEARKRGVTLDSVRRGAGKHRDDSGQTIPPERIFSPLGMTETFGMHSMEKYSAPLPRGKQGSMGRHLPGVERRIIDPDTGREVACGRQGELYVRGQSLMAGYYKRERAETFTRDGFFATGDLASIDEDDYLFFHGRKNEMIKTSGANVSPREVEAVLQSLPGVREAIVFGIPDAVKGERVAAVLVAVDGHVLDGEALKTQLRQEISPYKVPQQITVLPYDQIPRTGSEKAIKRHLIDIVSGAGAGDQRQSA
ncbi:MAG TPA: class I adenylate-forming enzyme family protein [Caulobacteraceae bacterium]|nr:class I adenylate-forming enzyme family protein [Caulobacteraceae bacterium]